MNRGEDRGVARSVPGGGSREELIVAYLVIHEAAPGDPVYERVEDLETAVEQVERLRNEEAVESAAIYELREVSFEFEPYFRVALQDDGEREDGTDASSLQAVDDPEPIRRPIDLREPEPGGDVVIGFADFPNRRGLFGR
jgi:hypothetical protein